MVTLREEPPAAEAATTTAREEASLRQRRVRTEAQAPTAPSGNGERQGNEERSAATNTAIHAALATSDSVLVTVLELAWRAVTSTCDSALNAAYRVFVVLFYPLLTRFCGEVAVSPTKLRVLDATTTTATVAWLSRPLGKFDDRWVVVQQELKGKIDTQQAESDEFATSDEGVRAELEKLEEQVASYLEDIRSGNVVPDPKRRAPSFSQKWMDQMNAERKERAEITELNGEHSKRIFRRQYYDNANLKTPEYWQAENDVRAIAEAILYKRRHGGPPRRRFSPGVGETTVDAPLSPIERKQRGLTVDEAKALSRHWVTVYHGSGDHVELEGLLPGSVTTIRLREEARTWSISESYGFECCSISQWSTVRVCTKQRANSGNGGSGPGYIWRQTSEEVKVMIPLPGAPVRAADMEVALSTEHVSVRFRDADAAAQRPRHLLRNPQDAADILSGRLYRRARANSLFWDVADGDLVRGMSNDADDAVCACLMLTFAKDSMDQDIDNEATGGAHADLWSALIKGDPEVQFD